MKKLALMACFALLGTGAFAQTAISEQGQKTSASATSGSSSQAGSVSNNAGNAQSITFNAPAPLATTTTNLNEKIDYGTQTIKNTPSVSGPPLVSSNDTCMGSASLGANGPGFGISLGKTYSDDNCVMLKNSRELWNMGMKAAAMALMCNDPRNREALQVTGYACPGTPQPRTATLDKTEYTDPIVRARLGLAPLK